MVGDTKDFKLETGAQAVDVLIGIVGGSFTRLQVGLLK